MTSPSLKREFSLAAHTNRSRPVEMILDASQLRLGAYLVESGRPTAWFADQIQDADVAALGITLGCSFSQQAVEALVTLVALREWASKWQTAETLLRVKSDSVSALVLTLQFKITGRATGTIARDMALDIAVAAYPPLAGEHVPGIAKVTSHTLSRKFQPGSRFCIPRHLEGISETHLPARNATFYRTLQPADCQEVT